jgi:outer membrane protein
MRKFAGDRIQKLQFQIGTSSNEVPVPSMPGVSFGACASRRRRRRFRVGFVNTDRIFREANTAKAAQAKLEQEFSAREKGAQRASAQPQEPVRQVRARGAHAVRKPAGPAPEAAADQDRDSSASAANSRKTSTPARTRNCKQVLERANRSSSRSPKPRKYDVVLQEAVYINPKHDITDKVIKALNAAQVDGWPCTTWRCVLSRYR